MEFNKPVVRLVSIAGHTPEVFSKVWGVAKDETPFEDIKPMTPEKLDDCMATDIPTQEYITTIWSIEGMPRAFWDQLDRCRLAAFWEQSGRVVNYSDFADIRHYWTPTRIAESPMALDVYESTMRYLQRQYKQLVDMGIPAEEARGIIPLHVKTRGTMHINLRALKGLIRNRVCFVCQGSYWFPVIEGILKELKPLLPPKTLKSLVSLPCAGGGKCPIEGNLLQRISGEDPNPICPVYLETSVKDRQKVYEKEVRRIKNYEVIRSKYMDLVNALGLLEGGVKSESEKGNGKCQG
jgi:predicted secreted protein